MTPERLAELRCLFEDNGMLYGIHIAELFAAAREGIEDSARLDWMIEHGTDEGGGSGFEFRVFIPCDSEDLRDAIDHAREP